MNPLAPPAALIDEMLRVCARLSALGYVAATDGNVSVRISDDSILCTPTALAKGDIRAEDLVVVGIDGAHRSGTRRASTEIPMHLLYYRRRADVRAVVHAHPVHATAFATAALALDACVFPEVIVSLGAVPLAPYATPSTAEVPASLEPFVAAYDAVLLANHGVVTAGASLTAALHRMEKVEHAAHIILHARQLGGERLLTPAQVEALRAISSTSYGIDAASRPFCITGNPGIPASPDAAGISTIVHQALREMGFTKD